MLIRAPILFAFSLLLIVPAMAQVKSAPSSAAVEVAPVDPVQKQARELDRLFGELHKENGAAPQPTIEKIWALWSRNDSPMAEILLSQSQKAMQDGVFDTSETMLNELIGSYPDYNEALNKRAMLYYNMKRYDDAAEDLGAVLETEPRHFGALSGLAAVYQAQGNVAKAAATLREAIAVNPHLETAKASAKTTRARLPKYLIRCPCRQRQWWRCAACWWFPACRQEHLP